ncbi:MAG: hypothetical protein ACI8R8_003252, partial [Paraglaciecola sp.]
TPDKCSSVQKIKRIYNGCLFKKEKRKLMLNSLLWSSCLYIEISERPQWWHSSQSTKVISPGQLSCRVKTFIHILPMCQPVATRDRQG